MGGGVCFTICANAHIPVVVTKEVIGMQKTTGTLSPGAHPSGFNGQDAYNDMLVITNESSEHRERTASQCKHDGNCEPSGLYARSAGDYDNRGGVLCKAEQGD